MTDAADNSSEIHAFMDAPPNLNDEVDRILNHPDMLSDEQLRQIACILQERFPPDLVEYGADFDLASEISRQLNMVQAMRRKVMTDDGVPKSGVSARDLKEVTAASNTLLQTLIKSHKEVTGMGRERAIEKATTTAIRTLPQETQDLFFARLEIELEAVK